MMKTVLKRIAPGYYSGLGKTTVDGKPVKLKINVIRAQAGAWYWQIDNEDAHDWYPTKRDAKDALDRVLATGFRLDPRYGRVIDR